MPGTEPAAHLESSEAGQHEVQYHEVRRLLGHPAQRLLPVTHAFDVVPVADQVPSDDIRDGRIVVDDYDPARRIGVIYRGHHCRYGIRPRFVVLSR